MTPMFPRMADKVPPGVLGSACVDHFEVSEEASNSTMLRSLRAGGRFDFVPPGVYARLSINGTVMMTDTPMERYTNVGVVSEAHGHVLIAGLGLGMILWPILAKSDVTEVTVIEKNPDVVDLVLPYVPDDLRLGVLEGDIYTWDPVKGVKFDTIYFDIWADISEDNLSEMATLHRRFGRRLNPGGWMGSWRKEHLVSERRRARQDPFRGMVKCRTFR